MYYEICAKIRKLIKDGKLDDLAIARTFIIEWLSTQSFHKIDTLEEHTELIRMFTGFLQGYFDNGQSWGGFLTYVSKNDLIHASINADGGNRKYIDLYGHFMIDCVP